MKRGVFQKSARDQKVQNYHLELNSFLDNAKWFKESRLNLPVRTQNTNTHEGEYVDVATNGIYDFDAYDVVVIVGLFIDPEGDAEVLENAMVLEVERYDDNLHFGFPIAILQEPLATSANAEDGGSMARAKINGSSLVNVNVTEENHGFFKLESNSAVMKSATAGQIKKIATQGGDGEIIAFGNIVIEPVEQQFKVVELVNDDVIKCVTYTDGVNGFEPINIALPWDLRKTPFDRIPTIEQLDPLLRYEYFSLTERRAFSKDPTGYEEAIIVIEQAQAQRDAADKEVQKAEIALAEAIEGGIPAEIEAAEIVLEEAEADVILAEEFQLSAAKELEDVDEAEEDQTIVKRYLKGSIIVASRNVVGFGDSDIPDIDGKPVVWLDCNKGGRFWMDNPTFEEPVPPDNRSYITGS